MNQQLRLRVVMCLAGLSCLFPALNASADRGIPVQQPKTGDFVFSILPKAFQRNPELEITVNTELTEYGRMLRVPTPDSPTYYLAHASGFKQMGDSVGGEKSPKPEQIEKALKDALAVSGYLPSTSAEQRPSLVILYFWGSHNRMDREMEAMFPELAARQRLERAKLVGGSNYMKRMARTLEFGEFLTDRTQELEFLRDQATDDLYYVVASAYDHARLAKNERMLVWRTTMTVAARGVSMRESMIPLIATAAPFFGRETDMPEIAWRRIARWGVIVGEDKVIEEDVPAPAQTRQVQEPARPAPRRQKAQNPNRPKRQR